MMPRGFRIIISTMPAPKISILYCTGSKLGPKIGLQEIELAQQLGSADHDHGRDGNPDLRAHAPEHHDGEDRGRLDKGEGLRADESLAHGEERPGETTEHGAERERRELGVRRVDAERPAGDLVLPQGFPRPPDRQAPKAQRHEVGQKRERDDDVEQEDGALDRRVFHAEQMREAFVVIRERDTEEGRARDRGDAGIAVGQVRPVDQDEADDLAEGQRHDSEVVAAQAQDRETEDDAPKGREDAGQRQADPKAQPEGGRQKRVGIGAHRIKGDVAKVEQPGEANDDVQAPAEHNINEDLDAVIVDPLERAAGAEHRDGDNGKCDEGGDAEPAGISGEEPDGSRGLPRHRGRWRRDRSRAPGDRRKSRDKHQYGGDHRPGPPRHHDQVVGDILLGAVGQNRNRKTKSDQRRETGLAGSLNGVEGAADALGRYGLDRDRHRLRPSRFRAGRAVRRA